MMAGRAWRNGGMTAIVLGIIVMLIHIVSAFPNHGVEVMTAYLVAIVGLGLVSALIGWLCR